MLCWYLLQCDAVICLHRQAVEPADCNVLQCVAVLRSYVLQCCVDMCCSALPWYVDIKMQKSLLIETCCSVLQCCSAVCCSVLQCYVDINRQKSLLIATCCSAVLMCVAACCSAVLICFAMCCSAILIFTGCCSVLQWCVDICCSALLISTGRQASSYQSSPLNAISRRPTFCLSKYTCEHIYVHTNPTRADIALHSADIPSWRCKHECHIHENVATHIAQVTRMHHSTLTHTLTHLKSHAHTCNMRAHTVTKLFCHNKGLVHTHTPDISRTRPAAARRAFDGTQPLSHTGGEKVNVRVLFAQATCSYCGALFL